MVSVDVKHHVYLLFIIRAQDSESRGGHPGLPSLISYGFCGRKATLHPTIY